MSKLTRTCNFLPYWLKLAVRLQFKNPRTVNLHLQLVVGGCQAAAAVVGSCQLADVVGGCRPAAGVGCGF